MSGPYDPRGPHGWINRVIDQSRGPRSNLTSEQADALVALVEAAREASSGTWAALGALRVARERAKRVFGL